MKNAQTLTLVVPPGSGGVLDYAEQLAQGLQTAGHRAEVFAWSRENPGAIDACLAVSDCIYLQYSGYGFAKRGAPLWMLHYLKSRRSAIKKLGVFFHELYASGPPWGSAFWLSPLQRHVAAGLAGMSDFWLSNRQQSGRWLSIHAGAVPNAVLPVFSNVGEAAGYAPGRSKVAIVFGGAARRRHAYLAGGERLFKWAKRNGLDLYDIGPSLADAELEQRLDAAGVVRQGRLDVESVAAFFSKAMFGIMAGSAEYVEKSGVFAAYCSYGIAPILVSPQGAADHAAGSGARFFGAPIFDEPGLPDDHLAVGEAAWKWYQGHSLDRHLSELNGLL